jgi:hypothetical protein
MRRPHSREGIAGMWTGDCHKPPRADDRDTGSVSTASLALGIAGGVPRSALIKQPAGVMAHKRKGNDAILGEAPHVKSGEPWDTHV